MTALDQITIKGFKSIRELIDFKPMMLNVLIGANGAGKSNLIDFFRMLRAMADGALQKFITDSGGPDGFHHNSPKVTKQISAHLKFGPNEFKFALEATVSGKMSINNEDVLFTGGQWPSDWKHWGSGLESQLRNWKDWKSHWGDYPSAEAHVYKAVSSWKVFHVHDTSNQAAMRRECSILNFRELEADAGNIAAFLLNLRESNASRYRRIREIIQLMAPFFDDFVLEPEKKGDNEIVRLAWRQKGSPFQMQPWQFSDGTIRFICLITALLQPTPPSTMVIDEPELGLHPFAIELLASLIREVSRRRQLVVSTQSPILINHFEPTDIVIVDRVDGASQFSRLDGEQLQEWLVDYSLGDLVQKNVIEAGPRYE